MSDRRKMVRFVSSQLPDGEGILNLGSGSDGPITAHVRVLADDLEIVSNCPEWVTLREVYGQLRWRAMPAWEQRGMIGLRDAEGQTRAADLAPAVADLRKQLTEINAKLDGLDDLRQAIAIREDDPSFTVRQVAQKLHLSSTKVYQLTENGELKSYKIGNQVRIKASHIREYQADHTRECAEKKKKKRAGPFNRSEADRLFGPGWDA